MVREAVLVLDEYYCLLCFVHTHIAYPCPGSFLKCEGNEEQNNKLMSLALETVVKTLH